MYLHGKFPKDYKRLCQFCSAFNSKDFNKTNNFVIINLTLYTFDLTQSHKTMSPDNLFVVLSAGALHTLRESTGTGVTGNPEIHAVAEN